MRKYNIVHGCWIYAAHGGVARAAKPRTHLTLGIIQPIFTSMPHAQDQNIIVLVNGIDDNVNAGGVSTNSRGGF